MTDPNSTTDGPSNVGREFDQFVELVAYLRSDEGCPWDRDQTLNSMIEHVREETEEVVEAIRSGEPDELREELGDFLLQGVFLAQIAREKDQFDITDVLRDVQDKLRRRHPHVFGDEELDTAEEVLDRWNEIKREEREI